tara:strand:- start:2068 stop:2481 length:414 start_codon:yes stop_codon:yes gene_type:complete
VSERFRNPSLAADAICLRNGGAEVLLIRRGRPPWKGRLAFPGGFVDYGEDPEIAALRELLEEAGVRGRDPQLYAVNGSPDRDPRKHIVSIFYIISVDEGSEPEAGDDAAEAEWIKIDSIESGDIAGDHFDIIEQLRK